MTNQVDFSRTNKFLSAIERIQLLGFEKSMRAYLVQGLFKDQLSNHLFHECAPPPSSPLRTHAHALILLSVKDTDYLKHCDLQHK